LIQNQPSEAEVAEKKLKKELVVTNETKTKEITTKDSTSISWRYSTISQVAKKSLGDFAYSATLALKNHIQLSRIN
jgi:hypothetical protein